MILFEFPAFFVSSATYLLSSQYDQRFVGYPIDATVPKRVLSCIPVMCGAHCYDISFLFVNYAVQAEIFCLVCDMSFHFHSFTKIPSPNEFVKKTIIF